MKKSIFLFFAAILCAMNVQGVTYTVAGSDAKILNGTNTWAPSDSKNDMTQVSGTTYWGLLLTNKSLSKTDYLFKVCKDHAWTNAYPSDNYKLSVNPAGTYNLAYSFNTNGNAVNATLFKTWTVAGSSAALGSDWKPEDANNDMSRDGSTFDYKLTKTNVNLKKSTTYECKVVKDHAWSEAYPGNNKTYTVDADGYYDVTFTFNVVTKEVTVTTTLIKNTVTASANPAEGGTVSGAGEYAKGSSVTLTATPATGYEFVNWTEGETVVSTSTQYKFDLLSDVNLVANFKIPEPDAVKYQVNVSANDNAMGTVTGGGEYEENATAILTATPNAGYQFVNWTVGGEEKSTNTTYSFTVTEAVEVVANFKEIPTETVYLVNNSDWTKVYAYGWDGTKGETPAWPGAEITANKLAEKYEGYDVYSYKVEEGSYGKVIFNNGSGKQTSTFDWTDGNYYYAVDPLSSNVFLAGDMNSWNERADELKKETAESTTASIKVNLTAKTYKFKLVIDGAWKGNTGTMQRGGVAVHEGGWSFDEDGGDDKNCKLVADFAGDYTFTWDLTTKKLTVAYPELPTYTVTATAENGTVTGAGEYKHGTEATLVATPNAGYAFVNWKNGEEVVSSEASYTFTVTANTDLVATFAPEETHEVTVSYICNSNPIPGHDATTLAVGVTTPSTITAPAITNYTFNGWTLGSGVQAVDANANPIQITTKAEGEYTLTANYTKIELTYTVTVPEGTEKCYIAGDMNSWSFQEMTPTANANEFTVTIDGATADHKYKYTCGEDWKYVEVKADGSNLDDNRKYAANDIVARWNCAPGIHLVGEMNNWNTAANKFVESGTTATVTIALETGVYKFKVNNDGEWLGNNGTMVRGGDGMDTGWSFESDKDACQLTADIAGDYTFTWNLETKKLTVTYPALPKHQVTATVNPAETGEVTGTGEYEQGFEATLVATPAAGYAFKNWTVGGTEKSTEATYTFTVNEPISLVANFIPEVTHEVTVSYICNSNPIPGHDATTLAVGVTTPSTITAPAITNYTFNGWTLGSGVQAVDANANPIQITTKAEGEYTLTANYTKIELTYTVKVPEGTEKCYIAGDMNSWSFQEMTPTANANEFTITIDGATTAHKYKYTCGEGWAYVEKKADGSDLDADRTYNANDVVAKWAEPAKCYLMGIGGDWTTGIEMEEDGDQFKLLCQPIAEGEQFKFKYGDTWTTDVENYEANGVAWVESYPGSGQYNITLPAGNYDFYYKKNENKVWIGVCTPATPTPDYTRTTTADKFGTICLPFGSTNYTGMELFECVGQETGKVYIASVTTLEAGVPYIFLATGTELAVYSDGTTAATPGNHNGLHGTFDDETPVTAGNYILLNNELRPSNGEAKVNANRAYLDMSGVPAGVPTKMPGRRYIGMDVQGENETTGVEDLFTTDAPVKVIENGQLIIIRDGVKYNVQGQKL